MMIFLLLPPPPLLLLLLLWRRRRRRRSRRGRRRRRRKEVLVEGGHIRRSGWGARNVTPFSGTAIGPGGAAGASGRRLRRRWSSLARLSGVRIDVVLRRVWSWC